MKQHGVERCGKAPLLGLGSKLRLASSEGTSETELSLDAVNAVNSVEVLDTGDLEASSAALARSDGGIGEEVLPDLANG